MDIGENNLRLSDDDLNPPENIVTASTNTMNFLKDFRTLGCSVSFDLVGYQLRKDPNVLICTSPKCMAIARKKVETQRESFSGTTSSCSRSSTNSLAKLKFCAESRSCAEAPREPETLRCGQGSERDVTVFDTLLSSQNGSPNKVFGSSSEESKKVDIEQLLHAAMERAKSKTSSGASTSSVASDTWTSIHELSLTEDAAKSSVEPPSFSSLANTTLETISSDSIACHTANTTSMVKDDDEDYVDSVHILGEQPFSTTEEHAADFVPATGKQSDDKIKDNPAIWSVKDLEVSDSLRNLQPCYFSYMWCPMKFALQAEADCNMIDELSNLIDVYVQSAPLLCRVPSVDEIIFAKCYKDGIFYRALVLRIVDAEEKIEVAFVDFGDSCEVKLKDCREPHSSLMQDFPIYAVNFTCSLPTEYDGRTDSVDSSLLTAEMISALESSVYMKVEEKAGLEWTGSLIMSDGKTNWSSLVLEQITFREKSLTKGPKADSIVSDSKLKVEKEEQQENHTKMPISVPDQKTEMEPLDNKTKITQNSSDQASKDKWRHCNGDIVYEEDTSHNQCRKSVTEKIKYYESKQGSQGEEGKEKVSANQETKLRNSSLPNSQENRKAVLPENVAPKVSPSFKDGCLVYVHYLEDFKRITLSAAEDLHNLETLTEIIMDYVKTARPFQRAPLISEILLAKYEDGNFYRAEVVGLNGETIKVSFIDYGGTALELPVTSLLEPNAEILSHPHYGLQLLVPQLDEDEAGFTSDALHELLKNGHRGDGYHQVSLATTEKENGFLKGDLIIGNKYWSDCVQEEFRKTNVQEYRKATKHVEGEVEEWI